MGYSIIVLSGRHPATSVYADARCIGAGIVSTGFPALKGGGAEKVTSPPQQVGSVFTAAEVASLSAAVSSLRSSSGGDGSGARSRPSVCLLERSTEDGAGFTAHPLSAWKALSDAAGAERKKMTVYKCNVQSATLCCIGGGCKSRKTAWCTCCRVCRSVCTSQPLVSIRCNRNHSCQPRQHCHYNHPNQNTRNLNHNCCLSSP